MDEAAQALLDSLIERMKEFLGDAWVDPLRVDITLRVKYRPGVGKDTRWFGTAVLTFAKIAVIYEVNLNERIVTRLIGG